MNKQDVEPAVLLKSHLHSLTESSQTLSDINSIVPTDSTSSPEIPILEDYPVIPILEDYPPEIITLIFSYINQHEIKLQYPNLAPYYLPMKYRKIKPSIECSASLPELWEQMLAGLLEAEWFRPEAIYIFRAAQFRNYPTHLLEKIKSVDICCSITEEEDYERLSKMENVTGLTIQNRSIFRNINHPIPKSVLYLDVYDATEDMQFPCLRSLQLHSGFSLKSWPPVTTLKIDFKVVIDFLVKFPVSLVHLGLTNCKVPEHTDLRYLINLRTLKIGSMKNLELPTTIRYLWCDGGEANFTRFPHLEHLENLGYATDGKFSFPDTIRQIRLLHCEINGLGNLFELNKLEYLGIEECVVDLIVLEVEYPQCLNEIDIRGITLLGQMWSSSIAISFHALPRALEKFTFCGYYSANLECIWPESVKEIELKKVVIKFLEWPLQLEQLTMSEMNLENISRTNIAKLNLTVFDVDQDANMGAAEALRLTKKMYLKPGPQQLPPNIREFELNDGPIELSSTFFLGSTLSILTLTKCKITVSSIVQLPPTLREISITQCELTSEMWSKFICPPKLEVLNLLTNKLTTFVKCPPNLKVLNLLRNELTTFVECPPKLEKLDLLYNKLTSFSKLNECTMIVALKGNEIPLKGIPQYSTLLLDESTEPAVVSGILVDYYKITEIGLVYSVLATDGMEYDILVVKNAY